MPVERWSTDRVLALAPDPGAARSAWRVGRATGWTATGSADDLVWGLCRGSAAQPYRTCVDLTGPAYRCSCPSRRFPCKHALGLLLLWADGGVGPGGTGGPGIGGPDTSETSDTSRPGDRAVPDWVREWRQGREARANRAQQRPTDAPVDETAARKRADQRAERVAGGLDELDRWLLDQVTHGLAGAERAGDGPYEAMAARLVDAQAPGLAEAVRRAGRTVGVGPHWTDQLLGRLGLLRLLVSGYRRIDALPAGLAATVRSRIGFPTTSEQVLTGPRIRDRWQVVGRSHSADDRLLTRRTWLRGTGTGRPALLLAFAPLGQALPSEALPGTAFDADLCFYPGAAPLRALVAQRYGEPAPVAEPTGATSVRTATGEAAALRAADPWLGDVPVLVESVRPAGLDHLVDRAGDALGLRAGAEPPWWLLAVSGGHPVTVAGELGLAGMRPLAVWAGSGVVLAPDIDPGGGRYGPTLPPELVSAALIGVGRRPWTAAAIDVGGRWLAVPPAGPAESSAGAAALLDATAVAVGYRRAGLRPTTGVEPDEAADAEIRPSLPPAAVDRLDVLVAGRAVPGGPEIAAGMLVDWLRTAAERGFRVPAGALPALLDLGRRQVALRPAIAVVAGRRGRWLAGRRTDWAYLLVEAADDRCSDPGDGDPRDWEAGTLGERVAHLAALRRRDPAAGAALLAASYGAEPPAERARFLRTLAAGLGRGDEPLLERGLRDRRKEVREVATELLAALPGSALNGRMAARATAAVRVERRALRGDRWVIDPPPAHDPDMARDGIAPPAAAGARAQLLEEVVARTPLDTWTRESGRTPAEVVAMSATPEWALPFHRGLARAVTVLGSGPGPDATREATEWAAALVDRLGRAEGDAGPGGDPATEDLLLSLHRVLPPDELAGFVAGRLRQDPDRARLLLDRVPGPWPATLAEAVFDALTALTRGSTPSWQLRELCALAARSMPVRWARPLAELAERVAARSPGSRSAQSVATLAAALTFRHDMIEELR